MKIEESLTTASVYPFDDNTFTSIGAIADPANEWLHRRAEYGVNWPAIGTASTAKTREFAQALLAAADWVDEQKAKQEEGGR